MKRTSLAGFLVGLLLTSAGASAQTMQPYSGLQNRPVKALSEQQIADLRAGRGMGLALAAELNGYPGPMHVLEIAEKLELSPSQREKIEGLIAAMKQDAIPLGEALILREQELDRLFASRTVTPVSLADATQAIGVTQASLRATHLKYHLSTVALLTAEQVRRYNTLRGYDIGRPMSHGNRQH